MKNLKEKIDQFLWAFMWLLPFLAYFVAWFRIGSAPDLLTYINSTYSFAFVEDIFNNVWQTAFNSTCPLAGYISYLVSVEIVHVLFDIVVFIPRFAHNVVGRCFECGNGKF